MRPFWYVLNGHEPVVEPDVMKVEMLLRNPCARSVAYTGLRAGGWVRRRINVSTVFGCLDQRMFDDGPPILFETMIFGRRGKPIWRDRYSTWDEAFAGHSMIVDLIRAGYCPCCGSRHHEQ